MMTEKRSAEKAVRDIRWHQGLNCLDIVDETQIKRRFLRTGR